MNNSKGESTAEKKRREAIRYLGREGEREKIYIREAEGTKLLKYKKTILLHTPDLQLPDPTRFEEVTLTSALKDQDDITLYITDDIDVYTKLAAIGKPVIIYENDYNCDIDFTGAPYVIQEIGDIPEYYFNRIYRRLKKLPWNILGSERLFVRETVPEDVPDFYRLYADPSITRYMEDLDQDPAVELRKTSEYISNAYVFYEYGIWTVTLRDTHEIIGRAGIEQTSDSEIPALGFMIGAEYQHQGYATEVCKAIIGYAVKYLDMDYLRVCVNEENKNSLDLCRLLGFKDPQEYSDDESLDLSGIEDCDGLVNLVKKLHE